MFSSQLCHSCLCAVTGFFKLLTSEKKKCILEPASNCTSPSTSLPASVLPNKRLADSFFPPAKVNCYHLRQVIYQQQIGPCTSVFFPGNECCEPSPTREGETIKLLTQTELSGRIFYRLIIHVFSLTNCYIRNVLHSTADLRRTRNAAYSPKKEKKRAFVCMLTILPCQQRDNEYSSIAGRNSDVTDMSHAALLQIHKLLFAQHQHSA